MIILDKKIPISIRGRNGGVRDKPAGLIGHCFPWLTTTQVTRSDFASEQTNCLIVYYLLVLDEN